MPSFRDDPRTATRSRWINTGGPSRRVRSTASILGNGRSVIGRRLPRHCGERALLPSRANAARHGRSVRCRMAAACRRCHRGHRIRGSDQTGSRPDCGSAIRPSSIRRLVSRPPPAAVRHRTRQCPPARQSKPASPRPTSRHGRAGAVPRSRPCAGKVRRAPRPAVPRLRSTQDRRHRVRVLHQRRGPH